MASAHLVDLISSLGRPRIAVVGDAILDQYVFGGVARISPEAPVPILNVRRREWRAGGAGSVVTNLTRLEIPVSFFSVRGADPDGRQLAELLALGENELAGFVEEEGRRTTVKTRHMGFVQHADRAMQQLLRVDDEVRTPVSEPVRDRLVAAFRARASEFAAVLVSDYSKGLITTELLDALRAAAPDVPFLVDPAIVDDYSRYRGSYLICPNRYEAQKASGMPCTTREECAAAAAALAEEHDLYAVALTMDKDGIFLHISGGISRHFPTRARRVTDVTGAGDMVLSILGLGTACGCSLADAVDLSNAAAGLEVRCVGVTPLSRDDILQEIRYLGNPHASKVKTLEELASIVEQAREADKSIVLANGCFDLFHPGHVQLVHGAAREGDVLVVALNTDASVRRLKGPSRPAVRLEDRMVMLASMDVVDYVLSFEEDTPERLIEVLRPDVLVKGEEYSGRDVVGSELVESYGGRLAFVPQLGGYSTSRLLGEEEGSRSADPSD